MKIAVIGISASGKSTFSRKLSQELHLPLFYMDRLFWKDNWQEIPEEEYLKKHEELVNQNEWIIEGYVDEKMKNRLEKADKIIYLDYTGILCVYRLIKRWLKHRKESRPELPKEALDTFNLPFFFTVLLRKERLVIERALLGINPEKINRFKSPRQLTMF